MKYCKIKEGTAACEKMYKIFNNYKEWAKHADELNAFLGFPIDKNIAFEPNALWVRPRAIDLYRPEWVKEFKKSDGDITSAKANSKVKKEWIKLCEKLGLESHKTRDFIFSFGLAFMGNIECQNMGDRFFILLDNDKYDFSVHEWAEPIEESVFLRERADWLDKEKPEQTTQAV